jgi:hypothetical protein
VAMAGVKLPLRQEAGLKFFITAHDSAGSVTLHRDTVPAAIKKADELMSDGCWNVEIVTPDGAHRRARAAWLPSCRRSVTREVRLQQ